MLAAGLGLLTIEKHLRAAGLAIKRETVKRHLERCLEPSAVVVGGELPLPTVPAADVRKKRAEAGTARDVASVVERRAVEALLAGELAVSTQDGLRAQRLLDRRAKHDRDREFYDNLRRVLTAGMPASGSRQGAA